MKPPDPNELRPRPERRDRRFIVRVKCESAKEAALIERGLRDPEMVALVKIIGALDVLPSREAKELALDLVSRIISHRNATKS
jgi:hypothetical protein